MGTRVILPTELGGGQFSVDRALARGVGVSRLRGPDLESPFSGVRVPAGMAQSLLDQVNAYAERMSPGAIFSHITAARLWGVPLPSARQRRSGLDVRLRRALPCRQALRCEGIGFGSTNEMSFRLAVSVSPRARAPGVISARCSARRSWWPPAISCSGADVPIIRA